MFGLSDAQALAVITMIGSVAVALVNVIPAIIKAREDSERHKLELENARLEGRLEEREHPEVKP